MARYKVAGTGFLDTTTGEFIPPKDGNIHYEALKQWIAQGNEPDPEYTQEEYGKLTVDLEVRQLKQDLSQALVWQFRMIRTLYQMGVDKGVWSATDIDDDELKAQYQLWVQKLNRLKELGQ